MCSFISRTRVLGDEVSPKALVDGQYLFYTVNQMIPVIPLKISHKAMRYQIMFGLGNFKGPLWDGKSCIKSLLSPNHQGLSLPPSKDLSYRCPTFRETLSCTTQVNDL